METGYKSKVNLVMYVVIKPGNAGGVTIFPASFEMNHEINLWSRWLATSHVWNHVQSSRNLFHVDQASRDSGRCICLWKLSRWRPLFKHQWASNSREDNKRSLIITTEYNNAVVGLKSPSRGVMSNLIKCCMYRLPGLLLTATPFTTVFLLVWIPHRDPGWLWVIQLTTCVKQ